MHFPHRSIHRLVLVFAFFGLAGCAGTREQIRPITESPEAHPDDSLLFNDWEKYRKTGLSNLMLPTVCGPGAKKTVFFVTLSGGGSRAAYFAARVLHELDHIGPKPITQNIDGIFSVSGGSLAAGLYGISRDAPNKPTEPIARLIWSEDLTDVVLSKQLAFSMARDLAHPTSLISYLFGDLSRTDLLQTSIEKDVFQNDDAPLTFRGLNPDRPPIFILATIATSEGSDSFAPAPFGSLFLFSKPDLLKLGVDISSVPIAKAISASAAFPGLLSPVTLPRYRRTVHEKQIGSPRFVHLIDGGNADNLGLLGVKRALLEDNHRLLRDCDNVVVLSVDAFGRQGFHSDLKSHESSPTGWVFDHRSALASFDALLAANRARLLGEFKSRALMPPGSEELCRKDGLPDDICGGGVRADWDEVNRLVKQKLYFVHLNFGSPETASQTPVTHCKGAFPSPDPQCEVKPVSGFRLDCELRQLKRRVEAIPTTFGLTKEEMADVRVFTSMLNHPKNICLRHLWEIVDDGVMHDKNFYGQVSASCDETPVVKQDQIPFARGRIFGDVIVKDIGERFDTFDESCQKVQPINHAESIKFLYDAKEKLISKPQYLRN